MRIVYSKLARRVHREENTDPRCNTGAIIDEDRVVQEVSEYELSTQFPGKPMLRLCKRCFRP